MVLATPGLLLTPPSSPLPRRTYPVLLRPNSIPECREEPPPKTVHLYRQAHTCSCPYTTKPEHCQGTDSSPSKKPPLLCHVQLVPDIAPPVPSCRSRFLCLQHTCAQIICSCACVIPYTLYTLCKPRACYSLIFALTRWTKMCFLCVYYFLSTCFVAVLPRHTIPCAPVWSKQSDARTRRAVFFYV